MVHSTIGAFDVMTTINIAKDFTDAPGWRYRLQGEKSGEQFREEILEPAFTKTNDKIHVVLDGARGYGISFLEESFGGLARQYPERISEMLERISFKSEEEPHWIAKINGYIRDGANG